jgi:alkylation response protein AidB-like acyl-CoA dehydrogenase
MDLALDETQSVLKDAVQALLDRHAGPGRARELRGTGRADDALGERLAESGFLDLFRSGDAGPLEACLVGEWVAAAAAVLPIGVRSLVAPALTDRDLPPVTAIVERGSTAPVRFAAQAGALIMLDGDTARLLEPSQFTAHPVGSLFGYPLATVEVTGTGADLGAGSAALARRWWRVALATEVAGTATATLKFIQRYLGEREQFSRPLLGHQALQHRVAECLVLVEAVRWLARETSFNNAPEENAAVTAVHATEVAQRVIWEAHQLSGAIGFTLEFDLHLWSLRLQALRVEAGGIASHDEALVTARWAR